MALRGVSDILIELDAQYSTATTSVDPNDPLSKVAINVTKDQTLANAFNRARDDLAGLITGGLVVRSVKITADLS